MRSVKCRSGIMGWQSKLQEVYSSLEEFESYCRNYGLLARLGYETAKEAWEDNPTIQGSTNPLDYRKVK